jgi:hypothetical protein
MTYFDASTWIGKWPFSFAEAHTARTLAAHLRDHGLRRALVSPLDAVFAPEPGPANLQLLRDSRGSVGLEPVPVINPALANWQEQLGQVAADPRVRAVRLLPTYHHYNLGSRAVDELMDALATRRWKTIIQVRLIDERHEFHAMNLKALPLAQLEAFVQRPAQTPVLASGLLRNEMLPLMKRHPGLVADLSYAEWHDTVTDLLSRIPLRQLVFASHTPFLITAAARAKLETSTASKIAQRGIAAENLERFLSTSRAR